ncbi:hypothetical protein [Persicobacter diffluens]|uniref:Uncharacterized protein n=1 Tax=Persicobacter diffluens TaxID=981 RepID=A0AAN5AN30_9BACT|nr:hypothetical protein PEDI_35180 [Persicobacter diffluens]
MIFLYIVIFLSLGQVHEIKWKNSVYEMKMPTKIHKTDKFIYKEGVYFDYFFEDSSKITIHLGGMIEIPILNDVEYIVLNEENKEDLVFRKGVYLGDKKMYWAEINTKNYNIYFENVDEQSVNIYVNSIFSFRKVK